MERILEKHNSEDTLHYCDVDVASLENSRSCELALSRDNCAQLKKKTRRPRQDFPPPKHLPLAVMPVREQRAKQPSGRFNIPRNYLRPLAMYSYCLLDVQCSSATGGVKSLSVNCQPVAESGGFFFHHVPGATAHQIMPYRDRRGRDTTPAPNGALAEMRDVLSCQWVFFLILHLIYGFTVQLPGVLLDKKKELINK